jgi:CBS domain-containing protein
MKVRDLMTKDVKSCGPDTNLAAATELMWNADCGVLPVVENGRLAGIITDRDISIALGTRNRRASDVKVGEVATRDVQTCAPDADVHSALAIMRRAKVRRLPVTEDGKLEGILALNDVIEAVDRKHGDIDYEDVMNTMKAICEHRGQKHPAPAVPTSRPPIPVAVA